MNELLRTALLAAEAAVAVHRRDQGHVALEGATEKARADYVSRTDVDAQSAALDVIRARHPGHAVLAEEDERSVAERIDAAGEAPLWIVDPLDGTANFLHTYPAYAASVAVAVGGRPVAGAVVDGQSGTRWYAAKGEGAYLGGRRIQVSKRTVLADAMVGTGFPFKLLDEMPTYLEELDRVLRASSGVRRNGAAALDLCMVARGSLDAFWERILMPWDFAAGWVVLEEAGGLVRRLDGSPLTLEPGGVLAANGPELLEALGAVVSA